MTRRTAVVVGPTLALRRYPFELTAQEQISGVPEISFGANAGGTMIFSHANRVGSALQFTATVDAFSRFFVDVKTYFRVFAIRIVRALSLHFTTSLEIVRIANQSRWARTLAEHASGSDAALDIFALIFAFSVFTVISVIFKNE